MAGLRMTPKKCFCKHVGIVYKLQSNFVSGDRLWFREAGEGPHVDIVRDPRVSGPRDHPQQGEPRCPSLPEETETRLQSMQQNYSTHIIINEALSLQEPSADRCFCAAQFSKHIICLK